jgi:hypothetical protein
MFSILTSLAPSAARADPVRIDLTGEIAATDFVTLSPGDPVVISLFVDSNTPDEDGAPNAFLATAPGTVEFQFADNTPGNADVLSISADAGSGEWAGDLVTTDPPAPSPVAVTLAGLGLTPDQILPDYASLTSGTAHFDSMLPFGGTFIDVDLIGIDIVPLAGPAPPVPAVSVRGRLSLALLVLGAGCSALDRSNLRARAVK